MDPLRLRRHTDALRWTLLTALGMSPLIACGGNTSSTSSGGATSFGGATANGGHSVGGASSGGANSGGASANGGRTTSGGASSTRFPCLDPMPAPNDPMGSIVICKGNWKHKTAAAACGSKLPRDTVLPHSAYPELDECTSDADCGAKPNGHCEPPFSTELSLPTNGCFYGCTSDADCTQFSSVCECGDPVGTCIASTCKSDADCGSNLLCASYTADPGCDFPSYACQTTSDRCVVDSDCPTSQTCTVTVPNGPRSCVDPSCVVGRPFLVEGELRHAHTRARDDWFLGGCTPRVDELTREQRALLSAHWAQIGCLEHASVAAFARFALELLAFGAPSELVELTQRALADETLHTKLAFSLASAYADEKLGPGPLDTRGALLHQELAEAALTAFLEGCIGETVAALEAARARDVARDATVRSVLARIAEDEARHAELGFRFVSWAAQQLDARFVEELLQATERALAESVGTDQSFDEALAGHGVLSANERAGVRRAALHDVVLPCVRALLQNTAGSVYVPNTERSTSQISCWVA